MKCMSLNIVANYEAVESWEVKGRVGQGKTVKEKDK